MLARSVGPEILVGTPDADDFKVLSGTARSIWLWLDEPRTVGELAAMAADAYGLSPSIVIADIDGLLRALTEDGLAERLP
jgi:hypothetical protein